MNSLPDNIRNKEYEQAIRSLIYILERECYKWSGLMSSGMNDEEMRDFSLDRAAMLAELAEACRAAIEETIERP